jgi:hypothetical protein
LDAGRLDVFTHGLHAVATPETAGALDWSDSGGFGLKTDADRKFRPPIVSE